MKNQVLIDTTTLQIALLAIENGRRVRNSEGGTLYQPPLEDYSIEALKKALESVDQEVPAEEVIAEWVTVPVQPTYAMTLAACQDGVILEGRPVWKHTVDAQARWRWEQMIKAAPKKQP